MSECSFDGLLSVKYSFDSDRSFSAKRYVALKITDLDMTGRDQDKNELAMYQRVQDVYQGDPRHLNRLLDHFEHRGPRGTHTILVLELMGASAQAVSNLMPYDSLAPRRRGHHVKDTFPLGMAKVIIKHVLLGLHDLHSCGIVHADVQHGNMLFQARPLEYYSGKPPKVFEKWKDQIFFEEDDSKVIKSPTEGHPMVMGGLLELDEGLVVKLSDLGSC